MALTSCDHGSAERHQMRRFGGSSAFSFRQPTRSEYVSGASVSAVAWTGVPQFWQKECLRFVPLSAVLTYVFGFPPSMRNVAAGTGTETRNADPVSIWQSPQLQRFTFAGSSSASYVIWPQWHAPCTFMASLLNLEFRLRRASRAA